MPLTAKSETLKGSLSGSLSFVSRLPVATSPSSMRLSSPVAIGLLFTNTAINIVADGLLHPLAIADTNILPLVVPMVAVITFDIELPIHPFGSVHS